MILVRPLILIAGVLFALPASAQDDVSSQDALVKSYVEAINQNDWDGFKSLLHPAIQTCAHDDQENWLESVGDKTVSAEYTVEFKEEVSDFSMFKAFFERKNQYMPEEITASTHALNISYSKGAEQEDGVTTFKGQTLMNFVLKDGEHSYLLWPCQSPPASP